MKQAYVIWIKHPSFQGRWNIIGVDRQDCLNRLRESFPMGGYNILKEEIM